MTQKFYESSKDLRFHLLSCGVLSRPGPVVESLFSRNLKKLPVLCLANAGDPFLPNAK